MSNGPLETQAAATLIQTLLSGGSPNGEPLEAFGEYRQIVEALVQAHATGGTPKVREAWAGIVRRHPELATLASADQDHWDQASASDASDAEPEQPKRGATRKQRQTSQTQQLLALATSDAHEGHDDDDRRHQCVVRRVR
jgi:hypothetical protein